MLRAPGEQAMPQQNQAYSAGEQRWTTQQRQAGGVWDRPGFESQPKIAFTPMRVFIYLLDGMRTPTSSSVNVLRPSGRYLVGTSAGDNDVTTADTTCNLAQPFCVARLWGQIWRNSAYHIQAAGCLPCRWEKPLEGIKQHGRWTDGICQHRICSPGCGRWWMKSFGTRGVSLESHEC